jgi:hypothetical protein
MTPSNDFYVFWHCILKRLGNGDVMGGRRFILENVPKDNVSALLGLIEPYLDAAFSELSKVSPKSFWVSAVKNGEMTLQDVPAAFFSIGAGASALEYCRTNWYDCGMQSVQLGHKLAASFMLTNSNSALLQDVRLPFPAFEIEVPDGLIPFAESCVKSVIISRYLVRENDEITDGFAFCVVGSDQSLWSIQSDLQKLLGPDINLQLQTSEDGKSKLGPLDFSIESDDQRVIFMIQRLIIGVSLYMTNGGPHKSLKTAVPGTIKKFKSVSRLSQPVVHNFSDTVQQFVRTSKASTSINVHTIVSGHWKMQPYGPGKIERKCIFVEPYWRGPEDSPMPNRPHIMK